MPSVAADRGRDEIARVNGVVITRQLMPSISVAEDDIRRFYDVNPQRFKTPEKMRVRHILIRSQPGSEPGQDAAARRKIEMIRDKIARGEDFAVLARQFRMAWIDAENE